MEGIEIGYQLTSLGAVAAVAGVVIFGVVRRFLSKTSVDVIANNSTADVLNEMRKERDDLRKDRDDQRLRADTFAKERMEAMEKVGALTVEVKLLRDQLTSQENELRAMEEQMLDIQNQLKEARKTLSETQEMLRETLRQNAEWINRCTNCDFRKFAEGK
jgi:peptidoglycan hydrolase CwlO-like protein